MLTCLIGVLADLGYPRELVNVLRDHLRRQQQPRRPVSSLTRSRARCTALSAGQRARNSTRGRP